MEKQGMDCGGHENLLFGSVVESIIALLLPLYCFALLSELSSPCTCGSVITFYFLNFQLIVFLIEEMI